MAHMDIEETNFVEPIKKNGTAVSNKSLSEDNPLEEAESSSGRALDINPEASNNCEGSASDSGVSNASSLTSDFATPISPNPSTNKSYQQEVQVCVTTAPDNVPFSDSSASTLTESGSKNDSFHDTSERKNKVFDTTQSTESLELLELNMKHHNLSSLSLEVNTSGNQLNLIAEGLGSSAGSLSGSGGELEGETNVSRETPNSKSIIIKCLCFVYCWFCLSKNGVQLPQQYTVMVIVSVYIYTSHDLKYIHVHVHMRMQNAYLHTHTRTCLHMVDFNNPCSRPHTY